MTRSLFSLFIPATIALFACDSLDEFSTDPGEFYEGQVYGTSSEGDCIEGDGCSFIRRGFEERTRLHLEFHPADEGSSGTLSTFDESCGATFDATPLERIELLQHDALSQLDFPGEGRLKSYVYWATPTQGRLKDRPAMVVVSLMRNEDVEVRIVAGSGKNRCIPSECASTDPCDYFGVFRLRRRNR